MYDNKDVGVTKTEDILNSILPPREYTKDKQQLYIESVLSTPATRGDVILLQQVAHPYYLLPKNLFKMKGKGSRTSSLA